MCITFLYIQGSRFIDCHVFFDIMNLSKKEKLTCFGINWCPVIYHLGRALLFVLVAAIVAFVTNFGNRLIDAELKVGMGMLILLLVTTLLILVYAFLVSTAHYLVFNNLVNSSNAIRNTLYFLAATLPVIGINLSLLQLMVFSKTGTIINSKYWYTEFPFFFVPLLLYVLLVMYWTPARLLGGETATERKVRIGNYLNSWLNTREMFFLMSYLDLVYGVEVVYTDNKVRVKDILVIFSRGGVYFFILRDGSIVASSLNSKDIEKWLLTNWFFRTSRWSYVNMLYVNVPELGDKLLELTHSVKQELREEKSYAKINSALKVNRRLRPSLNMFVLQRELLSHEDWDEMIAL